MKQLAFIHVAPLALLIGLLPLACKDTSPCDAGEKATGIGCFPEDKGGSAGKSSSTAGSDSGGAPATSDGGAPPASGAGVPDTGTGGSGVEPWGNPDATWGSHCEANKDCGPDAPICATAPLFYCTQVDCQEGEANFGVCPTGWDCFKYLDNPAICFNPDAGK